MTKEDLMEQLLARTESGHVIWTQCGHDSYETTLNNLQCRIWFEYPATTDGMASGPDIAKVTVGRVSMTFFSGTRGMDLVLAILAAGNARWNEHAQLVAETIDEAGKLLDEQDPGS